jgi:hypothetical protein
MDAATKKKFVDVDEAIDELREAVGQVCADLTRISRFLERKFPASDAAWGEPETPETPEE